MSSSSSLKRKFQEIEHKEDNDQHDQHIEPLPRLPWEVLYLLGPYIDPETLCIASCVSTTWSKLYSSEDLWKYILHERSTHPSSPYAIALETNSITSYKKIVSIVERDAKRRRKNQPEELKLSLSDLMFIVHVSSPTKKGSKVCIKGKDLEFSPNERFQIEVDVSNSKIKNGEKDVRLTWQVVYRDWENYFQICDTTRSLDTSLGWFTDEMQDKLNHKLVGDVKPCFNGEFLQKIGFAIVDSCGWSSLSVDDFLRYVQRFVL